MMRSFAARLAAIYVLLLLVAVGILGVTLGGEADGAGRWGDILITALAVGIPGLVLTLLLARTVSGPLTELRHVTRRIGLGDMDARAHTGSGSEVGALAREVNTMAERLADTVRRRTNERNEMAAVLAHMHDGIVITNADAVITGMNPAAARLVGFPAEQALNRSFIQVARDHELYAALRSALVQPSTSQRLEITLGRFRVAAAVTAVPAGEARGITGLVVLQDVTELRYLERARRDFVANISHELRTPLASIRLLVETVESAIADDPEAAHHFLHQIEGELDGMTQLVRELLELSRIESGLVELELHATPVEPLLAGVAERLRPMAERKGLTMRVLPVETDLPQVPADVGRVEQMLLNLVHNAIKFTPPGGAVTLEARRHADGVAICVRDTGIGIAPDELPRVFERFYKADKARTGSEGGTGLGLAIVKHLARAHGGQVWAESTLGAGSTFCFTLPQTKGSGVGDQGSGSG